jgi:NodT family efflux transporter outer membrane factor (OMF) lipoprotein
MNRTTPRAPRALAALPAAALACLAACSHVPAYEPPTTAPAVQWKETVPGWMAAVPADTLARGPWWTLFGDPALDALAAQVEVSNQNVAAAAAAVAQSQALLREQRAGLFPTIGLDAGATRSGSGSHSSTSADGTTTTSASAANRFTLGLGASWEPDLWGRVGAGIVSAGARAQASAADLANATLSAQAAFVADYLSLREADAEIAIIRDTIEGYRRALQITQNRYAAAIAQKSDVLQAQTQLAGAQADLAGVEQSRAQLAHAMAVLVGQAPSTFDVPPGRWQSTVVPAVPVGVPSELLQRRPDIAAAERAVAAANADVGVSRSAWFPALTLSASGGQGAARLADLFDASATTWSFGLSIAQAIFDGGANNAAIEASRAAWRQSVAQYRQTVLAAFQGVEDQLSASSSLERQQALRREASQAADQTEQQMLNRYKQGLVAYTDVVTAQASAFSARRALLQVSLQRQTTAVSLITALGGGWSVQQAALAAAGSASAAAQ